MLSIRISDVNIFAILQNMVQRVKRYVRNRSVFIITIKKNPQEETNSPKADVYMSDVGFTKALK
jgi:hypothetical protein